MFDENLTPVPKWRRNNRMLSKLTAAGGEAVKGLVGGSLGLDAFRTSGIPSAEIP